MHRSAGDSATQALVQSLFAASAKTDANPKPLIRSTLHRVQKDFSKGKGRAVEDTSASLYYNIRSWKTAEFAFRKAATVGAGTELPTLARGLFTVEQTAETDTAQASSSSSSSQATHIPERILVRGYDKFFNVGELSWVKPAAIAAYSAPPYAVTFKENGCIIFISALSPTQLVVTSKHALQSVKDDDPTAAGQIPEAEGEDEVAGEGSSKSAAHAGNVAGSHAGKGEEWLEKHLASVGKSKSDLARELWDRNETAVAELCDDSFEEHVLAYPPEKTGLHLHGLNANTATFQTRPMEEVTAFAQAWGLLPTRYLTFDSLEAVNQFTDKVGTTGEWEGEAIEGFVVRTFMADKPQTEVSESTERVVAPPYAPGQAWFFKVKFDEPYLMYRDWRELSKKMLRERKQWEAEQGQVGNASAEAPVGALAELSVSEIDAKGEKKSKNQINREMKALKKQQQRNLAASPSAKPPLPKGRSNRPETKLFIHWCYDRLYGSSDGAVKPNLALFNGIVEGKGIIRLRDLYLKYLETDQGRSRLAALGGAKGALAARLGTVASDAQSQPLPQENERPFTHVLAVPVAVPGCGKTSLFLALHHLFPDLVRHTQSDDVTAKKTGPTFLKNICAELAGKSPNDQAASSSSSSIPHVVFADRNNHLFQHRDEIIETVRQREQRGGQTEEEARLAAKRAKSGQNKKGGADAITSPTPASKKTPRVKVVGIIWTLDSLPLNTIHRILADRILLRGDNHQSLLADTVSASGSRSHESILWRFLEQLDFFGSAEGKGEGSKGHGDAAVDEVIKLDVEDDLESQLKKLCSALSESVKGIQGLEGRFNVPSEQRVKEALEVAREYKVSHRKVQPIKESASAPDETAGSSSPRYYGIAVEADLLTLVPAFLATQKEKATSTREVFQRAEDLFAQLKKDHRVNRRPHITLVHSNSIKPPSGPEGKPEGEPAPPPDARSSAKRARAQNQWDLYSSLASSHEVDFTITLGDLIFDDKVMAFSIHEVRPIPASASSSASASAEILTAEKFWLTQGGRGGRGGGFGVGTGSMTDTEGPREEDEWRPHITIGTVDESVRPFEANRVMRAAEEEVLSPPTHLEDAGGADGVNPGGGVEKGLGLVKQPSGEETYKLRGRLMGMN